MLLWSYGWTPVPFGNLVSLSGAYTSHLHTPLTLLSLHKMKGKVDKRTMKSILLIRFGREGKTDKDIYIDIDIHIYPYM